MPTIINRARLGNSTEDICHLTEGPFAGNLAVLDGYDLLLVPLAGKSAGVARPLFDVRGLAVTGAPRGVAYLASEALFAFNDLRRRTTLLLADGDGRPAGERAVQFPADFAPDQPEAIEASPGGLNGERLLMAAIRFAPELESRLEILRLVGDTYRVVGEVRPAEPVGQSFVTGAARRGEGFLVGVDDQIFELDAAGNVARSVKLSEALNVEGLAQLADGSVVAADLVAGRLFFFDKRLTRTPERDLDYRIGPGLFGAFGLAWDAAAGRHLVLSPARGLPPGAQQVAGVPDSLDAAEPVVDLAAQNFGRGRRMSYLPDEQLIAVAHQRGPRAILLFDAKGRLAETLDVTAVGSPSALAYIPSSQEFAVRVTEPGRATTLFFLTRQGQLSRTVDLAPAGVRSIVAVTHFGRAPLGDGPVRPGRLLVIDGPATDADPVTDRALIVGLDGRLLGEFNYRKSLGVLAPGDVAEVTTGEHAGALSIIDRSSNELVVFRLDNA